MRAPQQSEPTGKPGGEITEITTNEIALIADAVASVMATRRPVVWMPEQWVSCVKELKALKLSPEEFKQAMDAIRGHF